MNILDNIKKNKFYDILFLLFLLYPTSLVFGPALIEIIIFFSILIFFNFQKKIALRL